MVTDISADHRKKCRPSIVWAKLRCNILAVFFFKRDEILYGMNYYVIKSHRLVQTHKNLGVKVTNVTKSISEHTHAESEL